MGTEKMDTKKGMGQQIAAKNLVIPNFAGLMAPKTQSFNEVFDHTNERNASEKNESEESKDRSEKDAQDSGRGKKDIEGPHRSKLKQAVQKNSTTITKSQKILEEKKGEAQVLSIGEKMKETTRGSSSEDSGGQSASIKATRGAGSQAIPYNALGAERSMEEIEKMVLSKNQNHLPAELVDELVAFITGSKTQDKKTLNATMHQNVLGGELRVVLEENSADGAMKIGFEGDSHVLEFLQAHQEELVQSLEGYDFVYQLTFG
jgi:hypothetical protein